MPIDPDDVPELDKWAELYARNLRKEGGRLKLSVLVEKLAELHQLPPKRTGKYDLPVVYIVADIVRHAVKLGVEIDP